MDTLVTFFKALSDPTRVRIVALLLEAGELCVCDIERVLGLPQARISRHLTFLRNARVVKARRNGQWMHYSITPCCALEKGVYRELRKALGGVAQLEADRAALRSTLCACVPVTVEVP